MRIAKWSLGIVAGLLSACAAAQREPAPSTIAAEVQAVAAPDAAAMPAAPVRGARAPGYLTPAAADLFALLPPAPQNGDARDAADRRIFLETRALQGTPRWQMAAEDGELGTAAMLHHFACSLDIELAPAQAPNIVAMLQKATRDAAQSMARAKDHYKRLRPFQVMEGATCRPGQEVAGSYDYPSGHTTAGWAWAMGLAQIAPERAAAVLARGRAIGDSRVVCGLHNASAVEGARFLTSAAMAVITATPAWQADLVAARAELAALRSAPHARPATPHCEAEAALVVTYW